MGFLDAIEPKAPRNSTPSSGWRPAPLPARQEPAQAAGAAARRPAYGDGAPASHTGSNDGGTAQLHRRPRLPISSPTAHGGPSLAPSWYPVADSADLRRRRGAGRLSGQHRRTAR
ncbi:hypothetical protein GQ55_5G282900 [Panicum hallii var. hallii]|uniref:Uncharacterized protein n=1 Tax=Panicum hallii var. hallii TaxID=1504633 RepID=A0A2T7DL32_9POAL|nr:hypothetical protein GQ55_5G282900 [Panicum hallii var. hallii]